MATHRSQLKESGAITGMKFMFFIYRTCGKSIFTVCLYPVIAYYFVCKKHAREASFDFIARIHQFKEQPISKISLYTLSFKHFLQFGHNLINKLAAWSGSIRYEDITFHHTDILETLSNNRTGALIIVSHLGNQELSRALAAQHTNIKLNVLVHTKHAQKFNHLLNETNTASHLNLLQVTEISPVTAIDLKTRIDNGEMVVIAGDRTPVNGGHQSVVSFLGERADFPQGPYILASVLQCPVLLMFNSSSCGDHHIFIEKFSDRISLNRKTRNSDITFWAQKFANRLAEYTIRSPLEWNNFYHFWDSAKNDKG